MLQATDKDRNICNLGSVHYPLTILSEKIRAAQLALDVWSLAAGTVTLASVSVVVMPPGVSFDAVQFVHFISFTGTPELTV